MKNLIYLVLFSLFFVACKSENKVDEGNKTEEAVFVKLADFEAQASQLVGKQVKIAGVVDHVCKHGGKKLLLVSEGNDLHAYADERLDENLNGSEIILTGLVEETRIDESTCLKMEEDCQNSHKEGEKSEDELEATKNKVTFYRDSMKTAGVDHLSFYSLKYLSHEVVSK
jgi:hypothetical protein